MHGLGFEDIQKLFAGKYVRKSSQTDERLVGV